ncbi:MAG: hypothetical protein US40_C0002G0139 [Candidatus Roizmanbacteria bacterium GW2011_GWC2_37_13]|uniref:DUF2283 domain-containing protein n=1 Tax=Candidatus Roizmanbacteria bacterium GW2011_GWC2_37_13 TaxID=1618486 RepID=A0A0G0GKE8_9BACT|nr:MAG: hypothetical protein US38_C0013G0020 [Candidatus Roizmanbacteria bacterium GW2011_GWC1_37_12]KKQ26605.1 MAG: hypothetical protein US40_C0002G0139 [Candidatus Roizmanbacteria bacterium GW2011_GWC2_37_13]
MKKSKVLYDKESDSLYIFLKAGREDYFEEIEPNIVIEYNKSKEPIGIEILNASKSLLNKIKPDYLPRFILNDKRSVYKASSK